MPSRRTCQWRQGMLLLMSVGTISCHQEGGAPPATVVTLFSPSRLLQDNAKATPGYYNVQPGDSLWRIAKLQGGSVEQLAKNNRLTPPYRLYPGQLIKLGSPGALAISPRLLSQTNQVQAKKNQDQRGKPPAKPLTLALAKPNSAATAPPTSKQAIAGQILQWHWPTQGKIIEPFSPADGGNRGIDMTGQRGQAIYSSAQGRVVYAGNALQGYGHLLIIKHNEDWLSAYAHNDKLLVREQQSIQAGQKIATMGSSGAHSVRLHFEIRHKGKSVDPLCYLPQR